MKKSIKIINIHNHAAYTLSLSIFLQDRYHKVTLDDEREKFGQEGLCPVAIYNHPIEFIMNCSINNLRVVHLYHSLVDRLYWAVRGSFKRSLRFFCLRNTVFHCFELFITHPHRLLHNDPSNSFIASRGC